MAKPLLILSKCSFALMRNVAMEFVRISELIEMSLLVEVSSFVELSPYSLESVVALSLDRFSGDADKFGDTICAVLLRPLIVGVVCTMLTF